MFGLGMPEILLILAIALMVIGPKKLPDVAKTLGRAMGEFKKAARDFKNSIDMEGTVKEVKEPAVTVADDLKSAVDTADPSDTASPSATAPESGTGKKEIREENSVSGASDEVPGSGADESPSTERRSDDDASHTGVTKDGKTVHGDRKSGGDSPV